MRVCHCVGYMNNPGGVCCRDLPSGAPAITKTGTARLIPLTEEEIRQIVREELVKAKR